MIENNAGTAALTVIRTDYVEENTLMDAVFGVSGGTVRLLVTGVTATNIEWFGTIESKEI